MRTAHIIKIAVVLVVLAALASALLEFRWHADRSSIAAIAADGLFAILLVGAFIALAWLHEFRAWAIIRKWAGEQGYVVLHFKSPFRAGPFGFWSTSRGQVVYYVTVRDKAGLVRKVWARCGSYIGGVLFSDEIEIRWSEEPKAAG